MDTKRILQKGLKDEVRRTVLREAVERFNHELLDDEERQLLLDRIKRLRRQGKAYGEGLAGVSYGSPGPFMRGEDMDEQGMQVRLHEILEVIMFSDADELEAFGLSTEFRPDRVETFEQAGLLTRDKGVVVKMGDAEFQLTIVRSK